MERRYQIPGFQAPAAYKYSQITQIRPGGSFEWTLGPRLADSASPVFKVQLYSVYGVLRSDLMLVTGETPHIILHHQDDTQHYQLVFSHEELTELVGKGSFELEYQLDPASPRAYLESPTRFSGHCYIRIS